MTWISIKGLERLAFVALIGAVAGCQTGGNPTASSSGAPPAATLNPTKIQTRSTQPPPSDAKHRSSIGFGAVSMRTFNHPHDGDLSWVEELDIDGDGATERTELLFDDEDGVLFAYAETDVPCRAGGIAVIAVLVGVNVEGNHRGRAAGSGFYAALFEPGECGASVAGTYGCTFDPAGKTSQWVSMKVDEDNDNFNTDRPF